MNKEAYKRNFILLNVGYAYHNADWNWKNVHSPFSRIHYVKRGKAKILREDGNFELKEDHLYLTPSYVKHSYECKEELELYYLHIYEDIGKNPSVFDLINFPIEIKANKLDKQLVERLIEVNPEKELQYYEPSSYDNSVHFDHHVDLHHKSPLAFEMESEGIVKQLFSRFLTNAVYRNDNIEERILKSLRYIHSNIDNKIDINYLAEHCFLSKDHFIRLFKKEMNCTPGKYINRKKIEAAQLRLLIEDCNVKDIAYGLGFDNISYFNRIFTKITGENPGRYKKHFNSGGKNPKGL
ncbi:MAG: AraC family transcriptional regulator [Rikenellaceae bacterium]|nr:AraC family transcriptional regulator [Rikenellaceae bacterium]